MTAHLRWPLIGTMQRKVCFRAACCDLTTKVEALFCVAFCLVGRIQGFLVQWRPAPERVKSIRQAITQLKSSDEASFAQAGSRCDLSTSKCICCGDYLLFSLATISRLASSGSAKNFLFSSKTCSMSSSGTPCLATADQQATRKLLKLQSQAKPNASTLTAVALQILSSTCVP